MARNQQYPRQLFYKKKKLLKKQSQTGISKTRVLWTEQSSTSLPAKDVYYYKAQTREK